MNEETLLLDTAEAAEALRVAPITLARWRRAGKGPVYVAIGNKKIFYRRADLDRWIEEQQRQPEPRPEK